MQIEKVMSTAMKRLESVQKELKQVTTDIEKVDKLLSEYKHEGDSDESHDFFKGFNLIIGIIENISVQEINKKIEHAKNVLSALQSKLKK